MFTIKTHGGRRVPANKTMKRAAVKGKTYEILNNGGIQYLAIVRPSSRRIEVFTSLSDSHAIKGKQVLDVNYTKIFIGDNDLRIPGHSKKGAEAGNSILVEVKKHKYVYIGAEMYSFETKEEIKKYYSPVGNSGVPYPYAIGETLTYFMLDKKTIPNRLLNPKVDGYGQFYGHLLTSDDIAKKIAAAKKTFKYKKIH